MTEIISNLFQMMGLDYVANMGDVAGLGISLLLLIASIGTILIPAPKKESTQKELPPVKLEEKLSEKTEEIAEVELPKKPGPATPEPAAPEPAPKAPKVSWPSRLKKGLSRSRSEVWGKLENIFSSSSFDEEKLEEIEELLYSADIGPVMVAELVEELTAFIGKDDFDLQKLKSFLFNFLKSKMKEFQGDVDPDLFNFDSSKKGQTKVIMVVGVNGAGKTTTIGKLATKLTGQGATVMVGACDTFRAAAVDQLQVWCERAGATMIRAKEGADPSGVGYETLQKAMSSGADYCILDTAGRLHTKENLMEELKKSKRVLEKLDSTKPDHTLLVIDSITGQNALRQAEEFQKALGLTGLIFTKCDGSSKAGNAVAIVQKLKVPITYIGVGESVEDLDAFNLEEYLGALLDFSYNSETATLHQESVRV
ncbi:MAG: signal recognition particle-docking protein FtsY [Bacteriovoracaceae bacterium]|nr:signal recognition particle-docking protein FtsY [Bacteriovoracaceae bacterium]